MAISFSGLASGMDTSSWVEALVSVKQAEITKLESSKTAISEAQSVLNNIKSYFSSFESLLLNITDSNKFSQRDLFTSNIAESSNVSVLTATASNTAENTTYNIEVNQLASATEVNSGIKKSYTVTETPYARMDTRLFNLITDEYGSTDVHAADITFSVDNHLRTISVDENSTIASFIDNLDSIGIAASYNESTGIFSINMATANTENASIKLVSDASGVMQAFNLQDVNTGYKTENTIEIVTRTEDNGAVKLSTKFKDMGITGSNLNYKIVTNDNTTITPTGTSRLFTEDTTLEQAFNILQTEYGISASIDADGVITFSSGTEGNVLAGNLATAMGLSMVEKPHVSLTKMTSTAIVYSTQDTLVHRDSTLSQIGAVRNAGDTLVIRECDGGEVVDTITSLTGDSTVQDLFNILTSYGITGTIDDGVIKLNSTSGNFVDGNIATNIGILQPVAETYYTTAPTTMTSTTDINLTTALHNMSSDGSVVIYSPVYGIVSVNINKELTVQGFCDKINNSNYGIKAEIVGNKVRLSELEESGAYIKGMSSVLQTALKLSVGEDYSYDSTTINVYSNTDSGYLRYGDDAVEINGGTVISSINGYSHGNGQILLHQNGETTTITVDSTLTLEEFINNEIIGLAQYGITGNILSDGKAYLTSDSNIYLEQIAGGSQILTALKLTPKQQTYSGNHVWDTSNLGYTIVTVETEAAKGSDRINSTIQINGTTVTAATTGTSAFTGSLVFTVNGYYKTVNVEEDDTYNSLIEKLGAVGINAYMTQGNFYISSGYDDVNFISDQSTSKFADFIGLSGPMALGGFSSTQNNKQVLEKVVTEKEDKLSAANYAGLQTKLSTLSISTGQFSLYRNGQKKTIDVYETDTVATLQSRISEKFNDLSFDIDENGFLKDGYLRIKSSDANANISIGSTSDTCNFVAITGMTSAKNNVLESSRQLYKVNDKTSLDEEGLFRTSAKKSTLLSTVGITSGTFNINRNGTQRTITIEDGDTFETLQTKINSQFSDVHIDFDAKDRLRDGCLQIYSTNGASLSFSSTTGSEASNFVTATGLTGSSVDGKISSKQLFQKVLDGYFKVGDENIYITEGVTTISDIVSQINSSENSLATAYWDNIDGKLVIKSSVTGASAVNIESGTTNITELLGLTDGDILVMDNQKIGSNAIITINGSRYTSFTNTVTKDATNIEGLTINLKGLSNGSVVQLTVKRDKETLSNALENVIDGYNELMSNVDSVISKTGQLKSQSMLKLIRNDIRTKIMSSYSGLTTSYRNLSQIGIKTANAAANNISTANSDITMLSIDKEEFMRAFDADEEGVRLLLIGDGTEANVGILGEVYKDVFRALSSSGYFESANRSYNTQKENYSKKIVKGTAAIEKYRKRLENKFSSMDMMIAEMQNQFSSFLS